MNDYQVGKQIIDFFAVVKSSVGTARNGSRYLDLRLSDGRQEMPAKQWEYPGVAPRENTIILVRGMVDSYQGQIQFVIQRWRESQPGECDPSRFIPVCPWEKDDLLEEFFRMVELVNDDDFSGLLNCFISGPLFGAFTIAPGAKSIHHAYLHGLLEHSVDVAKKALAMADGSTNKDLLITGALLHDVGKIYEYDWTGCAITKTAPGYLLGHIALGLMIVNGIAQARNAEKLLLLSHMIASHHGKLEFGSPTEPQIKEAVILHTADMLDFQYSAIDKAVVGATPGGTWTPKVAGLGREFYVATKPEVVEEEGINLA